MMPHVCIFQQCCLLDFPVYCLQQAVTWLLGVRLSRVCMEFHIYYVA